MAGTVERMMFHPSLTRLATSFALLVNLDSIEQIESALHEYQGTLIIPVTARYFARSLKP